MIDAFYLFYTYFWLESDLHSIYKNEIQAPYNKYNLNENGINEIEKIHKNFKKNSLTTDRKERASLHHWRPIETGRRGGVTKPLNSSKTTGNITLVTSCNA